MKKYLITGAMALLAGFYLTSCTHDDIEYSSLYEEKTQSFEKVFKDLYGTIDPNHDWGFTPYVDITDASTVSGTRALTRGVNTNGNMWANDWVVPDALTEAQKDKVRRWFQQHQNPEGVSFSHSNFFVQQVYKGGTEGKIGPNSPEKYTAADGSEFVGSQHMDHLTCGTWGEGATTSNNDGRNFYDHVNNFNNGNCTDYGGLMLMVDSRSDAFGYYNSNGSVGHNLYVIIPGNEIQEWDNSGGSEANVSNMYFVGLDFEQLIGDNVYADGWYTGPNGNQYHYLKTNMNQYCGAKEEYNNVPSNETIQGLLDQGYLPVAGKADKVFVKLASCADGYYSDWIVRVIPGTKKSSGGDKEKEKEQTTTSDKYKAKRHVIMAIGRVFVEDLYNATRADIDFNDAVFDAIIWKDQDVIIDRNAQGDTLQVDPNGDTKYRLEIALLAAGGTIPLKIGDSKFGEVHDRFKVGLTTIVNTVGEASNVFGSMVTGKDYVYEKNIDITDVINTWKGDNPITLNIIPIEAYWVTGDVKVAALLNNKETHTYEKDDEGRLVVDKDNQPKIIESSAPVVPHVLQAPIGTAWPQERVNIGFQDEGPYHFFPNYVQNYSEYSGKVWKSNIDPFYLYADNRSPLAYRDKSAGYAYLTNIEKIVEVEGTPLWNESTTSGQFEVTFNQSASLLNNAAETSKIRIYVTSPSTGYWHVNLCNKAWQNYSIPDWNNSSTKSYNNQPADFPGYVEFSLTSTLKSAFITDNGFIIQTTGGISVDCITFIP